MKKGIVLWIFFILVLSIGGLLLLNNKQCASAKDIDGINCDLTAILKNKDTEDLNFNSKISENELDTPEQKSSLKPIAGDHYIVHFDDELIFFDTNIIDNIEVYSVKIIDNDIIIEGSWFLQLNRQVKIDKDTCLIKNSDVFPVSKSDTRIVLGNHVECLPNSKKNYLFIRNYEHQKKQHKHKTFIQIYNSLGGERGLKRVIIANKFPIN